MQPQQQHPTLPRRRRRRPQHARSLVLVALGALALLAAFQGARAEPFKDPAELIVPGGSSTTQEKLDAVQSRLGEVQGDLEKRSGAC